MLKKAATRERARRHVEAAVLRVRADPCGSHHLDDVASELGVSAERFHRVFREVYGLAFGDFVRRARLERAIALMRAEHELPLTDVTLRCGFSESSDFSRAFRNRYGIAPSKWDRIAPLNLVRKRQASTAEDAVAASLFPEDGPSEADGVKLRHLPPVRLAVLRVVDPHINANLVNGFDSLERWVSVRGQIDPSRHFVGLSHDSPLDSRVGEWGFQLGYPVGADVREEGEVSILNLPEMLAATRDCSGNVTCFIEAWDILRRRWLPDSGYVASEHPAREVYYDDPRPHGLAYWEIGCVLPVRPIEEN